MIHADLAIVSSVNPWVAVTITVLRRFARKVTIVSFHGSAWYESSFMR